MSDYIPRRASTSTADPTALADSVFRAELEDRGYGYLYDARAASGSEYSAYAGLVCDLAADESSPARLGYAIEEAVRTGSVTSEEAAKTAAALRAWCPGEYGRLFGSGLPTERLIPEWELTHYGVDMSIGLTWLTSSVFAMRGWREDPDLWVPDLVGPSCAADMAELASAAPVHSQEDVDALYPPALREGDLNLERFSQRNPPLRIETFALAVTTIPDDRLGQLAVAVFSLWFETLDACASLGLPDDRLDQTYDGLLLLTKLAGDDGALSLLEGINSGLDSASSSRP